MPAGVCHFRAILAVSLLLLAGRARAQTGYPDEGLQAWRQARAPTPASWKSGSPGPARASVRAGSYYPVSQTDEEAVDGSPSAEEGEDEIVPTPERGFAGDDGFGGTPEYLLDEENDASLGEFLEDDPTPWYFQGDVTFLSRSRPSHIVFTRVLQVIHVGTLAIPLHRPVLSNKQVKFDFEPGTRETLGRNLYRDILNRQHSVEFTYLGLFDWGANAGIRGRRISDGQITVGSLLSDVNAGGVIIGGVAIGGFNSADEHHVRSLSDLNNYELNYRIRRLPGRDRMVAGPNDTWTRQCTPGLTGSLLTGVRYVSINEQMSFSSRGRVGDAADNTLADFSAAYRVVTHNDLVGWQLGGDLIAQDCNWSLGVGCKAGVFANVSNQTSNVAVNNGLFAASPNTFFKASDLGVAFVGDLGLSATWRLTPRITLRSTYDFMWVDGIALAPQQIEQNLNTSSRVIHGNHTVFQGVSLGGEYRW